MPLRTSSTKLTCLIISGTAPYTLTAGPHRRTLVYDGFPSGCRSQNVFSVLNHPCPSLTHWRGLRSVARRRERAIRRSEVRPWLPEEDQAIFDFVEKYGSGDGRPGPVPKMWLEEVAPPEWAREYLEEAKQKKMEQNILDSFHNISKEIKVEKEVVKEKEESRKNNERVEAHEKLMKHYDEKGEGSTGRKPDSDLY